MCELLAYLLEGLWQKGGGSRSPNRQLRAKLPSVRPAGSSGFVGHVRVYGGVPHVTPSGLCDVMGGGVSRPLLLVSFLLVSPLRFRKHIFLLHLIFLFTSHSEDSLPFLFSSSA